VVPRAFGPLVPLYALAPRTLVHRLIGAMHPERIVTRADDRVRGEYERAIRAHGELHDGPQDELPAELNGRSRARLSPEELS
jgi:hypothetical protein